MSDETNTASVFPPPELSSGERRVLLLNIYERYWLELCRYLRARFGEGPPEPQDVAQQAFAQFAVLPELRAVKNPRAFLYRTAINVAIDHRRSMRRHDRLLRAAQPQGEDDLITDLGPERIVLGRDALSVLESAIVALPERERTFLLLNRLEGLSFAEIGRRVHMSPSGVRFIVEEALASCQAAMNAAERGRKRGGSVC